MIKFNTWRHNAETFYHCIFLYSDKFPVKDIQCWSLSWRLHLMNECVHTAGWAEIYACSIFQRTIMSCYKGLCMKTSHPCIKDLSITQPVSVRGNSHLRTMEHHLRALRRQSLKRLILKKYQTIDINGGNILEEQNVLKMVHKVEY